MKDIVDDSSKVLDKGFMMNMSCKYVDVLPPFKEYWKHLLDKKQMRVIAAESSATVLQFAKLRKELFHPSDLTNAATDEQLVELAKVAAQEILDELHSEKKATWKYLSVLGSPHSYQGCPAEVKENLKGREATNDRSESALGGTTHQLQKYGRIRLTNAAAVSNAKTKGYFCWFSRNGNTTKGMFHQFDPNMRECLLMVAIEDAPETISVNRDDLDKQREAKRKKKKMIKKKSLERAKEDLVEASYYWEMYHSDVCWKGKQSIVGKMLGRFKSESAKIEALKKNIRMHVIGLGWKQFAITWSHRGAKQLVEELAAHLRMIVREEQKLTPPEDPALEMPKHLELPILGNATQQLMESMPLLGLTRSNLERKRRNCKNRGRRGAKVAFFLSCNHSIAIVRSWMS
jgi:hypothetical protein